MPNKKNLIIGGVIGAVAAGLGLYFLLKTNKPSEEEVKAKEEEARKKQEEREKLFKQRILDELSKLNVKYVKEGGHITEESIRNINDLLMEYSLVELRQLFAKRRSERRKLLNNPEKYVEAFYQLNDEYLDLLHRNEQEVLKHLKINHDHWEKSAKHHSENPEFFEYINSFVSDAKKQLKSRIVSKEELLRILTELSNVVLPAEAKNTERFKAKLRDPTDSFLIFQEWCNDVIYEKFGVEYEDWVAAEKEYSDDPKIAELSNKIHEDFLNVLTAAWAGDANI